MPEVKSMPSTHSGDVTLDQLAEQIDVLRNEISDLTRSAAAFAQQKGDAALQDARSKADRALAQGSDKLEDVRETLEHLPDRTKEAVQQRPLMALGVAAGIGLLVGLLSGRR
ncbi:MAG: hypothetical protein AAGE18_17810 [Pseudomonadota bacterium]